jgi:diadenosine tetraphosphate (Ap4A) HIT family hydrolase
MFELHADLTRDCIVLGRLPLCLVLLMNDANYPWLVLVPARAGIREIYELSDDDQVRLLRESSYVARGLAREFRADKMNVAALGNVTPQLHVHHVVRYTGDPAWPRPVWGQVPAAPYTAAGRAEMIARLKRCLVENLEFFV